MKAAGAIRVFELLNCISNMSTSGDKCLVSKIASSNILIIYSVTKLVMFAESLVAFTDAERLIGEVEKNQAALNPERTIYDVKRLIGRKFDDPEVQKIIKMLPFNVVNKDGKPYVQVKIKDGDIKVFSPEEISAMILQKMKQTAEGRI
ncbi:hypothetical protein T459_22816 [Capsicum annuum]|uniref:Uncharacterized protein n=1 Tax=Capsicum annuum TaxID=4072 RepID=A0A2G2YQY3_CAPAN|nr:hypothetical protein T459_22816 [Capsicum annuum]